MAKTWFLNVCFPALEDAPTFESLFSLVRLADVHELDEEADGYGGQDDEDGDSSLDPPCERGDAGLEGDHAVLVLFDGEAAVLYFFGDLGDLGALVLQLAVEACVSLGDLPEVAANALGHGGHSGFICFFGGSLCGEVSVRHGDEPCDVRQQLEELGDYFGPHRLTNPRLCRCAPVVEACARDKGADGQEENGGDDSLGPEAVDAPLLQDVGFDVAEEESEEEADLCELEGEPPAAHEGEDADDGVACNAEHCDGNVRAGFGIFVEGAGREDSEAAVIDGSAIELFGDGAGRGLGRVHVVNAKGHDGDGDSCYGEQGDQIFHVPHSTYEAASRAAYGNGMR